MQLSTPYFVSFFSFPLFSLILVLYAAFYYLTVYEELLELSSSVQRSVSEFSVTTNIAWEQLMEASNTHFEAIQKRSITKMSVFFDRILRDQYRRATVLPAWCQCEPIVPRCPPGPPGPPGCRGEMGLPGQPGRRGLDNFETLPIKKCTWRERVACIICPRGPPGRRGRMGPDGEKGSPGKRGPPGTVSNSFRIAQGPPGMPGEPGRPGKPGPPGVDGENGRNGYVIKPNTLVKGPPGPVGSMGPPGRRGPPGEQGLPGPMGPPGSRGVNGQRGAPGEPGRQGRRGRLGGDANYCPCPARSFVVQNFKE